MKVAAVQMASRLGDVEANLAHATDFVRQAVSQGARLVALPEFALCGSVTEALGEDMFRLAQPLDGPVIRHFAALARELAAWLCVPLFEQAGERRFNAVVVLDSSGTVAAHYRKRFVPNRRANEKFLFHAGDLPSPVWDVDGVRFGVNICFERQFVETSRIPALKGADVLVHLSHTWGEGGSANSAWFSQAEMMARLNSIWVLAACATHWPGQPGPGGGSLLADPLGQVVSSLHSEESLLLAEVDPALARETRARARMLCEQRTDVLQEMIALGSEGKG